LDVVRDALSFDSSSPSDPILHLFSPFSVSLFELYRWKSRVADTVIDVI
jgi:hypothetical protein